MMPSTNPKQGPRHGRPVSRVRPRWLVGAGLVGMLAGALASTGLLTAAPGLSERAMSEAWHRAVDADPSVIHAFEPLGRPRSNLHPTSTAEAAKALIVGEQVTLVTPDGAIHTLRVCDPASPSAATAPDCLNAFAARAIVVPVAAVPQRSL
jgi:hypothetical protein